ncbi:MAG: polysaccharide biosynthesis/export family protein [Gemmatimonadota bacterium]
MSARLIISLLFAATTASVAGAQAPPGSLRLGPGDAVRLLVLDEPALAGEHAILEDGTALLPLIGLIRVAGIDFAEVVETVRAAYAAELIEPVVILQPLVRVRVLGEVRAPGLYLVDPTQSLHDVLALAGGTGPGAAGDAVVLLRDGQRLEFDLHDEARPPAGALRPGDEIVVPRRSWLSENLAVLVGAGTSVLAAAVTALLVR